MRGHKKHIALTATAENLFRRPYITVRPQWQWREHGQRSVLRGRFQRSSQSDEVLGRTIAEAGGLPRAEDGHSGLHVIPIQYQRDPGNQADTFVIAPGLNAIKRGDQNCLC